MRLLPFPPDLAPIVSAWATAPEEVRHWCGQVGAPVPAEKIVAWSSEDGVRAFGLYRENQIIAYGELWVDDDEEEVELARLIVDPSRRGQGVGRALVGALTPLARASYADVFMRVYPDNLAALRCYAAAGFARISAELEAEWNRPQPVDYVWLSAPST